MNSIFSIFRNFNSVPQFTEDAMAFMNSYFYKIIKVNLKKDTYKEIKVLENEKKTDKGYSKKFSEWIKNLAMTGSIHKEDQETYLNFLNIENIKKALASGQKKCTVKYRRNVNGSMRWVTLILIPAINYGSKNQSIFLYVFDVHDSLCKELSNTSFLNTISNAITQSYLSCVYINLEKNTSRIIHIEPVFKSQFNENISIDENINKLIKNFVLIKYQTSLTEFCNFATLDERLKNKTSISCEYIGANNGLIRAIFIPVNYDSNGKLKSVIFANRYVDTEVIKLRNKLETEKTLVECLTALSGTDDFKKIYERILKSLGEFYNSNTVCLFRIDYKTLTFKDEFEWCNDNIKSRKDELQALPLEFFARWIDLFNKNQIVYISDIEQELNHNTDEYKTLKKYNVTKLIAVPFYDKIKRVTGFMAVNEPKKNLDTDIVARSAATYVMEEKIKQDYTEKLYIMSYTDIMTKTLNRAAYIRDMKRICDNRETSTGILYADVNGLKNTNDTKGHEAGDILIDSAVALLRKYFSRKKDYIYRLGGDEFVVLSMGIPQKEFMTVVENLKDYLTSNWILSCGGTWFQYIMNIDNCTKEAEQSMYKNKADYYSTNHIERRR